MRPMLRPLPQQGAQRPMLRPLPHLRPMLRPLPQQGAQSPIASVLNVDEDRAEERAEGAGLARYSHTTTQFHALGHGGGSTHDKEDGTAGGHATLSRSVVLWRVLALYATMFKVNLNTEP